MHIIRGINIALIDIMAISLGKLHTTGQGKRFQAIFVDSFAPERISLTVSGVVVVATLFVLDIACGLDLGSFNIGR